MIEGVGISSLTCTYASEVLSVQDGGHEAFMAPIFRDFISLISIFYVPCRVSFAGDIPLMNIKPVSGTEGVSGMVLNGFLMI